jgi:hypothetical protein
MNTARGCGSTNREVSRGICASRVSAACEHPEMGIGREGDGLARTEQADVDAFMYRLEQAGEGVGAGLRQSYLPGSGAGVGVSELGKFGR